MQMTELSEQGKRNLLRFYMQNCPCCHPDEVYDIKYNELDQWLESHDKRWYDLEVISTLMESTKKNQQRLENIVVEHNKAKDALQRIFGHDCVGFVGNSVDKCTFCNKVAQKVLEPENCK
jgi:hypothetical protein